MVCDVTKFASAWNGIAMIALHEVQSISDLGELWANSGRSRAQDTYLGYLPFDT